MTHGPVIERLGVETGTPLADMRDYVATMRTAGAHPGVSFNDWSDDAPTEAIVGQSILNGVPVRVSRAPAS